METKLQEIFTKEVDRLIRFSKNAKYERCSETSNRLVYTALMFNSKTLLFLCESLTYMFDNLFLAEVEKDSKEAKAINKDIVAFLEKFKKIEISEEKIEDKLIELMIDIRYKVTKFQVNFGVSDRLILK